MTAKFKTLALAPLGLLPLGTQPVDAAPLKMKPTVSNMPSWAGFYGGLNVGVIVDQSRISGFVPVSNGTSYCFAADCSATNKQQAVGALGGVQIGYNFQTGRVVYGVETDIGFSSARKTTTGVNGFSAGNWTVKSGIESLSTFRGRLGYTFDNTLVYATGGLAMGKTAHSFQGSSGAFTQSYSFADAGWRNGWVVGGGVEYKLGNKWSVKGEALFYDLGRTDLVSTGTNSGFTYAYGANDHITGTVARIGLNYLFH